MVKFYPGSPFIQRRSGTGCRCGGKSIPDMENTSSTERSIILNKIADRIEQNLEYLATVETIDNGKAVRETLAADIPLAIDHFRYFVRYPCRRRISQ
jgi:acyl-CoA reductase-like NAD-dependent aldehyde dehydrogenase